MARISPLALTRAQDASGNAVSGATLAYYRAGTSTPTAIYSDVNGRISLGTSLNSDSSGFFAVHYLDDPQDYKAVVTVGGVSRVYDWLQEGANSGGGSGVSDADPLVLANIAALRAEVWGGNTPTLVQLVSNYVAGDSGGIFRLDASDLSSADDSGTIIVDAVGNRWKRQYIGDVQAAWFGVRGDGATDNTATLNAILANTAFKDVQLPVGDVRVTALTINRDDLTLRGYGRATVVTCTSLTADIITIGDGTNERSGVNLESFDIWASVTKSAGWAIRARRWTNGEFRNLGVGTIDKYVTNANAHRLYEGVYLDLFAQGSWTGNSEIVCAQRGIAMRGLGASGYGSEISLDGQIRIYKTGSYAIHVGGDCGGVYIHRVDISECAKGVHFDKTLTAAYNREAFIGEQSTIDNCTGWAVNIEDDSLETLDLNCWISGCGNNATGEGGVRVAPTTGVATAIKASSLRVQSCKYDGVQINAGNINWNGGFCRSNGVGTNGGHGILLGSVSTVRTIIQGVSIHNNGNVTRGWGISIGATCDNFTISDNDFFSNGQGQLTNGASYGPTQVIRNNRGFVTENSGIATMLSGNSTVTVTHGCDAVPNYPVVTNIGHGTTGVQVQSLTATTFQIAVGSAVGANSQFQWTINAM